MFKLTDDLKRILTGLAYQDAGEMMTTREKYKLLSNASDADEAKPASHAKPNMSPANRRIALITDGRDQGAAVDYALETCSRLEGKIDLLLHDPVAQTDNTALENRFRSVDIQCHTIRLGAKPTQAINRYLNSHSPVTSIIVLMDGEGIKPIIDEIISQPNGTIAPPLVLIGESTPSPAVEKSAA